MVQIHDSPTPSVVSSALLKGVGRTGFRGGDMYPMDEWSKYMTRTPYVAYMFHTQDMPIRGVQPSFGRWWCSRGLI